MSSSATLAPTMLTPQPLSGDMNLPSCLLCVRTSTSCVFPDGRKRRRAAGQIQVSQHPVLGGTLAHANSSIAVPSSHPLFDPGLFSTRRGFTNIDSNPDQSVLFPYVPQRASGGSLGSPQPNTVLPAGGSAQTWNSDIFDLGSLDFEQVHHEAFFERPAADQTMGGDVTADGLRDLNNVDSDIFDTPSFEWLIGNRSEIMDETIGPSIETVASSTTRHATPSDNVESTLDSGYPDLPYSILEEIVGLYFEKVHHFVPIIHKPRFLEKYAFAHLACRTEIWQNALKSSLLLNCMLALAAGFSKSPLLNPCPPFEKGVPFGENAANLYYHSLRAPPKSGLEHLQGCILFAFYLYLSGPSTEGWLVIGTCTRLAYDMCLDRTDMSDSESDMESTMEWVHKEERRRAWWSIWELDTFSSAIACRRHAIDQRSFKVKLPVSDLFWFAGQRVDSAAIEPDALYAWRALRNCENQDDRAWFLVCNYLLLIAYDLGQQSSVDATDVAKIQSAVVCFSLLLPERFHIRPTSRVDASNGDQMVQWNWIFTTNMILQGVKIYVRFLGESVAGSKIGAPSEQLLTTLAAGGLFEVQTADYRCFTDQILRIIKAWPPEYISCSHPFVSCLIIGPAAIHARVLKHDKLDQGSDSRGQSDIDMEVLKLALSHLAKAWKFGALIVDLADSVAKSTSN